MLTSTTVEIPDVRTQALEKMVRATWFAAVPGLVDSLIHDARNPLNALTLNLEVLTEKIRALPNPLPAADKNLRAIREQVFRVDAILRKFADFLAARPAGEGEANLSELVVRAVEVLGHEARSGRVRMLSRIDAGLKVRLGELSAAPFVALQPVLRGIQRSVPGGEISVSLAQEGERVRFTVTDSAGSGPETHADVLSSLEWVCTQNGGSISVRGADCQVVLPLVHQP